MSRTSHRNEETAEGYVEQSQSNNTANNETEGSGSTEQDEVPPDQYLSRQGTYEDPDKFDPQSVTSRQHYKRRREQWAVMYEKYVVSCARIVYRIAIMCNSDHSGIPEIVASGPAGVEKVVEVYTGHAIHPSQAY